jgi:hypothetical protein
MYYGDLDFVSVCADIYRNSREIMDLFPNEQYFDLDKKIYDGLKEHHKN